MLQKMWEPYLGHTVFLALLDLCPFFLFCVFVLCNNGGSSRKKNTVISLYSALTVRGLSHQPKYHTVNQHVV